jgi:antitoxin component YwqK of YwqJK toxin-antitoxin module
VRRFLPLLLAFAGTLGAAELPSRDCPPGASLRREGLDFACETSGGVGEGPFWRLFEDGTPRYWGVERAGRLHGTWIAWHDNGARATEAEYVAGVLRGRFRKWNRDGQLLYEGSHDAAGEMHGRWFRWWPNGNLRVEWEMQHGISSGIVKTFHESGGPASAGLRREGRREGVWTWWDLEGRVAAECRYDRGAVVDGSCGN